jgi:hypothetical protein
MPEAAAAEIPKVMEKVFNILKRELSAEEYLIYLKAITPMIGNATVQLRDITKKMSLEDVVRRVKKMEKNRKHNPFASVRSV